MGKRRARSGPYLARVEQLARRGDIITAGLIGAEFSLDPVVVLDEPSRFRTAVRAAAFRAVQNERQRAEDEAAKRPRPRR